MLKKHILIPFEKYEKLMKQSNRMSDENNADSHDGQCVSHTQHIEVSRDKQTDYGLDFNKETEEPTSANFDVGLQKGEGGDLKFNVEAGLNKETSKEPPQRGLFYKLHKGPPGRRASPLRKKRKKAKHWQTF